MYQQLWGYKVEEKLYLGVREQKRLNTTDLTDSDNLCTFVAIHVRFLYKSIINTPTTL
jgi:hypothetical protein